LDMIGILVFGRVGTIQEHVNGVENT
jgi:hypothetical protein